MNKGILGAAAMALALSSASLPRSALALTVTPPHAIETADLVQKAAIFCGPLGCGPIWRGPRHWKSGWGPWGYAYRPACPLDYYYACRRGPLGYGQCACWPYHTW
jgi:hypothetical protein